MEANDLRFYLDEHLDIEIACQLKRRGIDIVTVPELKTFGQDDLDQLQRAARLGRVFCTNDSDLIELATEGVEHSGIVFGQQEKHFIGTWVRFLLALHEKFHSDELANLVTYVSIDE